MKGAWAVYYYQHDDYYNIMVHRESDNGSEAQCESCVLTKAEAWLVVGWAKVVLNENRHRHMDMSPWAWTIFLPDRVVETRPLLSPIQRLVEAIGRHPAAESDPDVIDAINTVEDALTS